MTAWRNEQQVSGRGRPHKGSEELRPRGVQRRRVGSLQGSRHQLPRILNEACPLGSIEKTFCEKYCFAKTGLVVQNVFEKYPTQTANLAGVSIFLDRCVRESASNSMRSGEVPT